MCVCECVCGDNTDLLYLFIKLSSLHFHLLFPLSPLLLSPLFLLSSSSPLFLLSPSSPLPLLSPSSPLPLLSSLPPLPFLSSLPPLPLLSSLPTLPLLFLLPPSPSPLHRTTWMRCQPPCYWWVTRLTSMRQTREKSPQRREKPLQR